MKNRSILSLLVVCVSIFQSLSFASSIQGANTAKIDSLSSIDSVLTDVYSSTYDSKSVSSETYDNKTLTAERNEIIVKFKKNDSKDILDSNGKQSLMDSIKIKHNMKKLNKKKDLPSIESELWELSIDDNRESVLSELLKNPSVEYAEPNYKIILSDTITNGKTYKLVNKCSTLSLEIGGSSLTNGATANQWSYVDGYQTKNWYIQDSGAGDGSYKIINKCSGKSLEIGGSSQINGATANQWTYVSATNQQWFVQNSGAGDGSYKIINKCRGLCSNRTKNGLKDVNI
jgi:Ricin-type beta-trefoil lectin domain-like